MIREGNEPAAETGSTEANGEAIVVTGSRIRRDPTAEHGLALFVAGLTTFGSMYSTQAVLPELTRVFGSAPAVSALAVSVTTGLLALAMVADAVVKPSVLVVNLRGRPVIVSLLHLSVCALTLAGVALAC